MTKFLDIDVKYISLKYKNTIISNDKIYTFAEYLSTLYYCYKNKFNCFIGNISSKDIDDDKSKGIYY